MGRWVGGKEGEGAVILWLVKAYHRPIGQAITPPLVLREAVSIFAAAPAFLTLHLVLVPCHGRVRALELATRALMNSINTQLW